MKNTKGENVNCEFAEKVSALIDGELFETELKEIRKHISECTDCQNLEKDFLFFRQQIKQSVTEEFEQKNLIQEKQKSFFNKKISLPVPVFSFLILLFLSLSGWFLLSSLNSNQENSAQTNNEEKTSPKEIKTESENSLARFDKGGKAEIYVAPR